VVGKEEFKDEDDKRGGGDWRGRRGTCGGRGKVGREEEEEEEEGEGETTGEIGCS
jgi:hypothetical protein